MSPQDLLAHSDSGQPWPAGAGAELNDLAAAYALAQAVRALRIARGELPRGHKIGFTNRLAWPRLRVSAPMWGTVWQTTLIDGDGHFSLPLAGICQPRIEPELVVGFKASPPAGADADAVFAAIDWLAPGFEIVQSHRADGPPSVAQVIADGGVHARLLVGPRQPRAALARDAAQLHRLLAGAGVELGCDGQRIEQGSGASVLDSPLQALVLWLAELRACPGAADLAAGDVVSTGTWTAAHAVQAGQTWTARFDAGLPALRVDFS